MGTNPKILSLWSRDLYGRGKSDAALSTGSEIYIGTRTLPLPSTTPTDPQPNSTNIYICTARSPLTHQLAREPAHRQLSYPAGPTNPPTEWNSPSPQTTNWPCFFQLRSLLVSESVSNQKASNWLENRQLTRESPTGCS